MALDSMSGVNYVTKRLVEDVRELWPVEGVTKPLTREIRVELGGSSQVDLHEVTVPSNILQSSPLGDFRSKGVRAVVIAGDDPVFTTGRCRVPDDSRDGRLKCYTV